MKTFFISHFEATEKPEEVYLLSVFLSILPVHKYAYMHCSVQPFSYVIIPGIWLSSSRQKNSESGILFYNTLWDMTPGNLLTPGLVMIFNHGVHI